MHLKKLLLLLFLGVRPASAQTAVVTAREFSFLPAERSDSVRYSIPVIRLPDVSVANKINDALRHHLFESEIESGTEPLDSLVLWAAANALVHLEYEEGMNKNGILSISFRFEGMGAHPVWWQSHINFDLSSRRVFTLDDVI